MMPAPAVYARFTEGHDLEDLRQAHRLLDDWKPQSD